MEIELIEPDYYYHIYNRGINSGTIFSLDEHYFKFMQLCKTYLPRIADIYAFCLLPNHFHLLIYIRNHPHPDRVVPPCQGMSLPISHLCNAYAQWYNKKTDRKGNLFQRPFKRKKITNQEYLKRVIYYIHRNPMHHNLINNPANYPFSSYLGIIGNQPTFLQRDQIFEWFGGRENFIDYHTMQFDIDADGLFEND